MRLSEFKDEKAIEVVAKLLVPIGNIAKNRENAKAKGENILSFASSMLRNNASDVKAMLAILDEKEPEEYHCTVATVFKDVLNMISDPELLEIFGLQRQTAASSGSASENIEAQET